tara:strand:+ start:366 stop:530 length:165 start_codon:yes stop_codon:yes gene_type:complete
MKARIQSAKLHHGAITTKTYSPNFYSKANTNESFTVATGDHQKIRKMHMRKAYN